MEMTIKPSKRGRLYKHLLEEHQTIAAKLELPKKVEEKSLKLLHEISSFRERPKSVAAGCIYAAGRLERAHITQAQIADAAEMTETTVRASGRRLPES